MKPGPTKETVELCVLGNHVNGIRRLTIALMAVLFSGGLSAPNVLGATHYVSPTGGNNSPYTNWADAATDIQSAIDVSTPGDMVLVTITQGQKTNALAKPAPPAIRHAALTPQELAAQYEQAGRKHEAATLYEDMVRTNTTARKLLPPRLVTIYAETGETNKALTWAHEVMKSNPDPQAYLAGVHARLGQTDKARKILEHEIASTTNVIRSVTLRWQLAEVYGKQGDAAKVKTALTEAVKASKGTALESTAQKRLNGLKQGAR